MILYLSFLLCLFRVFWKKYDVIISRIIPCAIITGGWWWRKRAVSVIMALSLLFLLMIFVLRVFGHGVGVWMGVLAFSRGLGSVRRWWDVDFVPYRWWVALVRHRWSRSSFIQLGQRYYKNSNKRMIG